MEHHFFYTKYILLKSIEKNSIHSNKNSNKNSKY
jgi:hypothetical protein